MYKPIYTLQELQTYLANATLVAFDFETAPLPEYRNDTKAALDAHKSFIVGISFSVAEGDAVYLPIAHKVGQNANNSVVLNLSITDENSASFKMKDTELWQWLGEFFTNPNITKIAHNLAFESAFLYKHGIIVQEPVYDTIAAAQLIYKDEINFRSLSDCGLKTLVAEYYKEQLPTFADTVGEGGHFDELDPADDKTVHYACADADYALRLYHSLNNWFERFLPKHTYIVEKVESPTAVYVGLMRYNGLPVDRQLMVEKRSEAERMLIQLKGKITFIIGEVNIGANASTAEFKKYIFEELKLPKMKTTASDKDALDDEALILLKEWCAENKPEWCELFELVQDYRHWGKIKSTYIDGYIKYISNATRRLHPDLLPLTTETVRFDGENCIVINKLPE